jgi:tRNA pseudouridine38-40 synthase
MRVALGIEYDGHDFYGWQSQDGLYTLQACLEKALSAVAIEPIRIFCAGRTDAGVHATGQVVHFDTNAQRPERAWTFGTREHMPASVTVRWAQTVDENFHARFSAVSRRYRYVIYNNVRPSAILVKQVTHYHRPLDAERMHSAAQCLLGQHDFSSFRSSQCQAKSAVRTLHFITITRQQDFVIIELQANAFLHHMVRNLSGVLLRIGSGQLPVSALQEILDVRDRKQAFETAPAAGLYLTEVTYPEPWIFPKTAVPLLFY